MSDELPEWYQRLERRLDTILVMLLDLIEINRKPLSEREKISILDSGGLRPTDIARALGKKPKYVSKELSLIRKSKKGKKEEEGE